MKLEAIHTANAPATIGPYSQAQKVGNLLFCSGQIALDPKTMQMVGATAAEQAEQVMKNLAAVLGAAGASFGDVVKATIFLVDLEDFGAVNAVCQSCHTIRRAHGSLPESHLFVIAITKN